MGTPNCLPEAVAFELGSQGSGVTDEAKRPVAGGGNTLRDAARGPHIRSPGLTQPLQGLD